MMIGRVVVFDMAMMTVICKKLQYEKKTAYASYGLSGTKRGAMLRDYEIWRRVLEAVVEGQDLSFLYIDVVSGYLFANNR